MLNIAKKGILPSGEKMHEHSGEATREMFFLAQTPREVLIDGKSSYRKSQTAGFDPIKLMSDIRYGNM